MTGAERTPASSSMVRLRFVRVVIPERPTTITPSANVESARLHIDRAPGYGGDISQVALIFLLARAFSSGCAALTGVEAISNGVPAFRKPKSANAATTLLLLGGIAITMLLSIIILARNMGLKYVDPKDLHRLREPDGSLVPEQFYADFVAGLMDIGYDGFIGYELCHPLPKVE